MLVRVEAAALNFSDLLMIDDRYQIRPERPFVPGQEIAGTVIAVGDDTGFAVGERVVSKVTVGGLAEFATVRGDMGMRAPAGFSLEAAAALPVVYTTAMVALTECTVLKPGETVLVLAAAGGVGARGRGDCPSSGSASHRRRRRRGKVRAGAHARRARGGRLSQ